MCLLAVILFAFIGCNSDSGSSDVSYSRVEMVSQKNVSPYVYMLDLPGIEIAFLSGYDSKTKEFDKYYVFQYDSESTMIDVSQIKNSDLLEFNTTNLKVLIDGSVTVFTIDSNYLAINGETVYYGYGLSERYAEGMGFKLVDVGEKISDIGSVVELYGNKSDRKDEDCSSGGEGSSSCSVAGSVGNVKSNGCSVTCESGYYACCNDSSFKCSCKSKTYKGGSLVGKVKYSIEKAKQ